MRRWLQGAPVWRRAFCVYAVLLFIATHWPRLELPLPGRSDLLEHLTAFGLWAGLLVMSGFFGAPASWRNAGWAWPIAIVYAAVDEGLQAIPSVHRNAAIDDWLANVGGITIGCLVGIALARWAQRRDRVDQPS